MTWELYEVWSEDDVGHQELVDTTKSLKKAKELAKNTLELEGIETVTIFQELDNGDTVEIERLTLY
jgi:bacterioferritin (cytochrome b1)